MTAYHGGKQRIGKIIASTIVDYALECDRKIVGYCEPFCGMLGVYQHIPPLLEAEITKPKYYGGDMNKSVILMWKKAQKGKFNPNLAMSRERFDRLKYDGKFSAEKGFIGHVFTYRGVFFDGYFPHKKTKVKRNLENVKKIGKVVKKVKFSDGDYNRFSGLKNYIIYCDPPYHGTEKRYYRGNEYRNRLDFDTIKFWNWCRKMARHNIVFVSEYKVPKNMATFVEKIWQKNLEKLYTFA